MFVVLSDKKIEDYLEEIREQSKIASEDPLMLRRRAMLVPGRWFVSVPEHSGGPLCVCFVDHTPCWHDGWFYAQVMSQYTAMSGGELESIHVTRVSGGVTQAQGKQMVELLGHPHRIITRGHLGIPEGIVFTKNDSELFFPIETQGWW